MLRIAAQPARRLPGFRQRAAQVSHRARRFGGLGTPRCVARIAARWCAACWTCTSAGTNSCSCWTALPIPELDRWMQEFHLYPQERVVPEGLPAAAIRGCYVSRDPIRLLVVDKEPGGVARRAQRGRQCRAIPRDRAGGSGGRFHPGTSAASDSPHAGRLGRHGRGLRRGSPARRRRVSRDVSAPSNRCVCGWRAVPLSARGIACCRFPAPACW